MVKTISMEENKSNMYEFIGETINPLSGECPHKCSYCYVESLKARLEPIRLKYSGELRLDEKVLKKRLKSGVRYFVGSCNDIFANEVPFKMKKAIIDWCNNNPQSEILLQTKNPDGLLTHHLGFKAVFGLKKHVTLCVTIETDDDDLIDKYSAAPKVSHRMDQLHYLTSFHKVQVTVEPIMRIKDIHSFAKHLSLYNLEQINIGADSKGHNLPEPTKEEVLLLISELERLGQKVHLKSNLKRIIGNS